MPYQRSTFVTPAFAGYVSGSQHVQSRRRGGADRIHGLRLLPRRRSPAGRSPAASLIHEEGPTADITLQWATYFDAADQAGISRIYVGHPPSIDDLEGRRVGSICGNEALALALRYFDGSARP